MTKLLAAIKELEIPLERLKGGILCSQRKPFVLAVLF